VGVWVCVCGCMCVCERERERRGGKLCYMWLAGYNIDVCHSLSEVRHSENMLLSGINNVCVCVY
jgi:hypothetical protein